MFYCSHCKRKLPKLTGNGGTGYAVKSNGHKICYDCCAIKDAEYMHDKGKITLYLTLLDDGYSRVVRSYHTRGKIINWPGTLSFPCRVRRKVNTHNFAGTRYDVWFRGPDGFNWYGVTYGENTQLCHCKRTKDKWIKEMN